jgi:hypothetical protein
LSVGVEVLVMASTSYALRNQRFAQMGFGSYGQARRLAKRLGLSGPDALLRPTTSRMLDEYPEAARRNYEASLRALTDMGSQALTIDQAATWYNAPVAAVIGFGTGGRSAPEGRRRLERRRDGSYTVRAADRMLRPMRAIEAGVGTVVVDVRGSRAASKLGSYWNAVDHYLTTGNEEPLRHFRGVTVGGVELETDADAIDALAYAGLVEFETIYQVAS